MNGLVFYFLLASLPFLQSCFVPLAECWILKQFENCYILFDIRSLNSKKTHLFNCQFELVFYVLLAELQVHLSIDYALRN